MLGVGVKFELLVGSNQDIKTWYRRLWPGETGLGFARIVHGMLIVGTRSMKRWIAYFGDTSKAVGGTDRVCDKDT